MSREQLRIVCIWCGHNLIISEDYDLEPHKIEPSEYPLFNIRAIQPGPGRGKKGEGGGFPKIAEYSIIEALEIPELSKIAEQVRQRIIIMVKSYLASGIIEMDEVF